MSLELPPTIEEVVELLELIPHPEGGFFRETFRSGSTPMASRGRTDLGAARPEEHLVTTSGRGKAGDDDDGDDGRRNALTSIYWMPTRASPHLPVVLNRSAHVHSYHGGLPFSYVFYDPETKTVSRAVLGPDLHAGHRPQVVLEGGIWKTGRLLTEHSNRYDYCLLGEAVAPGFDVADFRTMDIAEFSDLPPEAQAELRPYFQRASDGGAGGADLDFDSHYDDDEEKRADRARERM